MNRRDFIAGGAALGATLTTTRTTAASQASQAPAGGIPAPDGGDLAIVNARVITLEPGQPDAQAVLVRGGRIALVGATADVKAQAGRSPVFDAAGRTVTPGLVDAHCHFEMACCAAAYHVQCQTPPLTGLSDILAALKTRAAVTPPGRWIIGRAGFSLQNVIPEKRLPTRLELDQVTTRHPLLLYSGLHVAIFNTRGFQELDLWEGRPPRGAFVHRDAAGVPTGVATEVWTLLPPNSVAEVRAAIKAHARDIFLAKGITSISTLPYWSGDLRADQEAQAAGELPIRLRAYYHVPKVASLDALIDMGLLPGVGDDLFRVGGIKIFIDGTAHDGTGTPLEDYKFTQPELDAFVGRAHGAGLQLIMHCLTEGGPGMGLAAVEAVMATAPGPLRHRLEHAARLQSVDEMRRLKRLGMRLTLLPPTARGARARRPARYRTLVAEGVEPVCVTDATGTTPTFNPWISMAGVVARPDEGGGVAPDETVSFDDALRMWTIWAARAGFEERHKGTIATGKLGDFAVLSGDPRRLPSGALFDLEVDATIIGGRVVYERGA